MESRESVINKLLFFRRATFSELCGVRFRRIERGNFDDSRWLFIHSWIGAYSSP